MVDTLDDLERLQKLRESGVLNEEEFQMQKSEIIARRPIRETELTGQHEWSSGYQIEFLGQYRNRNLSIVGSLMIAIGVFLPAINVPILGNINFIQNGNSIGFLLLAASFLTALLATKNSVEMTIYTGAFSLSTIISTFFAFRKKLNEMQMAIENEISGSPLKDMAGSIPDLIQLQWGWVVILLGCLLVIYAGWLERKLVTAIDQNVDQAGYVGFDENHYTQASLVVGMIGTVAFGMFSPLLTEDSSLGEYLPIEKVSSASTTWDCSGIYGEPVQITLTEDTNTFSPRNPDGGKLEGRLLVKTKEKDPNFEGYNTFLTLEGSGTGKDAWSIYEADKGPALFFYNDISGDGTECTLLGQSPKYSIN